VRIRRIDGNGTISTIAGGLPGHSSSPDGPALPSAIFPQGLAVDGHGNIAFADGNANVVRQVTLRAAIQTLAGGNPKPAPDGTPARAVWLVDPVAIAFDKGGDLYIAEAGACLIRKDRIRRRARHGRRNR
jgi:hypothetical protein